MTGVEPVTFRNHGCIVGLPHIATQTFYQGFLISLFHDGLNSPRHQQDFVQKYGRIPYLNGGMFSIHELEEQYPALDIADEAFENLFRGEIFERKRFPFAVKFVVGTVFISGQIQFSGVIPDLPDHGVAQTVGVRENET